jgi:hypothetical protein
MRQLITAGCIAVAALAFSAPAQADVASDIRADLVQAASAVPGAQVSVGPAAGDALEIGSGQSVSVTMTPQIGTNLAGILMPAGALPLYSTTRAAIPVWDLAIVEAVKHALARGAQLESLAITRNFVGLSPGTPELTLAIPPYAPWPEPPTTMPPEAIQGAIQQALPAWAQSSTIAVTEDAATERVVTVTQAIPGASFALIDPAQLLWSLTDQQKALRARGANIGRVVARLTSTTTGNPLYTGGADAELGFAVIWQSPLVRGVIGEAPTANEALGTAGATAQDAADQGGLSTPLNP